MEAITIMPGRRDGRVSVPLSKSHLHRLLIADYLAGGDMFTRNFDGACDDVAATQRCLKELGTSASPWLDCCESGSTLRFLLPLAPVLVEHSTMLARGRLPKRPLQPFLDLLRPHGLQAEAVFPLKLNGTLRSGRYVVPGDVSSQIITGLLFALPLLKGDSVIHCEGVVQSRGYVDMTLDVLKAYGISIDETPEGFLVAGVQKYILQRDVSPERDWSSAAFWLAMNEMGCQIELPEMNPASKQPDRAMLTLAKQEGGVIDVSQCPDIFPALAALASSRNCITCFVGVERLHIKESDRVVAMADVLSRLGVQVNMQEHCFEVMGQGILLKGGVELATFNDHRIAMAATTLAAICREPIVIENPDCVAKSYPDFFTQFSRLK
ncbi:MAG: hypothetical protein J5746_02390 [Victivallales bacterium]|nr:hypothetical protein [Victivallales bacterium]